MLLPTRLISVAVLLGVFSAVILSGGTAHARSLAEVNALYPGGMNGGNGLDGFNQMDTAIYNNVRGCIQIHKSSHYRDCVNDKYNMYNGRYGGAYVNLLWLSLKGQPSVAQKTINAGSNVRVDLQLNTMDFIGNALVKRSGKDATTDCTLDSGKKASNSNPDDSPGSIGTRCRDPAKTGENFLITGLYASSGDLTENVKGKTFDARRSSSSRYWVGDVASFFLTGNFTESRTIVVTVEYKHISSYHANPPGGAATYICGSKTVRSWTDFSGCSPTTKKLALDVTVNPPAAKSWRISGHTTVNGSSISIDVEPGQTNVTFRHYVKNNGPDATTLDISADTKVSGGLGTEMPSVNFGKLGPGVEKTVRIDVVDKVPTDAKDGDSYCQQVGFQPTSSSDASYSNGSQVCAVVVRKYTLTPTMSVIRSPAAANSVVKFSKVVTSDSVVDSKSTHWSVRQIILSPGVIQPDLSGFDGSGRTCSGYYQSFPSVTQCTDSLESGDRAFSGTTAFGTDVDDYTIPTNLAPGTRVCRSLVVDPYTQAASSGPRASSFACVLIAKSPRLQVWGNDVRVGSDFTLAINNKESVIKSNYGSWGEYGMLAPGVVAGLGSGELSTGSLLTFANTDTSALGNYAKAAALGLIPDVRSYLQKAGDGSTKVELKSDSTINGLTLDTNSSKSPVYISDGDITIDGDIINDTKGSNLQQIVIIAHNIYIKPSVKRVDAWLVATGVVDTCAADGTEWQKTGACGGDSADDTLRINGPVMAGSLSLKRTGGANSDTNAASEIINLRGDAYVWMHKLSVATGSIQTVYARDIPPRY